VQRDGTPSAMLEDRVRAAAALFTQRFHLARALWLARRAGLRASGLAADARSYGRSPARSRRGRSSHA
jgi:vancomycin permeability regulator SanA